MKKCNVCGKRISDFAVTCPYCHSTQNQILPDIQEKKRELDETAHAETHIAQLSFVNCSNCYF